MEPSSIPSQYGGTLDFQSGDLPNLDDAARALVGGIESPPESEGGKRGYLKGPMRFYNDHIEVLGTDHGKPRRATIPVPASSAERPSAEQPPSEMPSTTTTTTVASSENEEAPVPAEKLEQMDVAAPAETAVPSA